MMSTRKYLKALCLLIVLVIANARRGKDANMSLLFTSWKKLFELGEWGCQLPTEATGTHPPTTDRVVCLITTYCGPRSLLCVKCLSPNSEWRSVKTENSNWPEQRLREESIVLPQINQCPSLVLMGDEWSWFMFTYAQQIIVSVTRLEAEQCQWSFETGVVILVKGVYHNRTIGCWSKIQPFYKDNFIWISKLCWLKNLSSRPYSNKPQKIGLEFLSCLIVITKFSKIIDKAAMVKMKEQGRN